MISPRPTGRPAVDPQTTAGGVIAMLLMAALAALVVVVHPVPGVRRDLALGGLIVLLGVCTLVVRGRAERVCVLVICLVVGINVAGAFDAEPAQFASLFVIALIALRGGLAALGVGRRPAEGRRPGQSARPRS